ncbi:MAG: bifunctional glutamate--cysteine ligase GshA/glutathione synthetase GshB [Anaerofustis sp.]
MKNNRDEYRTLELSTQILIKEALRRKISVEVLDEKDNLIRIKKDGKTEYIKQATRTSADNYIAPLLMENKEVTKLILREAGIRVPEGITVTSIAEAEKLLNEYANQNIVVKPKSTNFGKGVAILKNARKQDILNAVQDALHYDDHVLIESFLEGKEYRFLVIGDEVAAILHRVPANVTGDGMHTIKELVAIKNDDPLRGIGYVTPLEKINLGKIETDYLALAGKSEDTIPQGNETVWLRENSNISTGGDSIDFTDDIPQAYQDIAVRSAGAVGAQICGADIIIQDITQQPNDGNYGVIELNFNPAIHIHDFPYRGKNRHVEDKVLDLLGF